MNTEGAEQISDVRMDKVPARRASGIFPNTNHALTDVATQCRPVGAYAWIYRGNSRGFGGDGGSFSPLV